VLRLDSLASFAWVVNKQQQDWMHECCNVSVGHAAKSTAFGYVNEILENRRKNEEPTSSTRRKSFNGISIPVTVSIPGAYL